MHLAKTTNTHQDFCLLTQALDAELALRYGVLQKAYDKHNVIDPIDTAFIGYEDGLPIACGCFKKIDDKTVEIKRMFVLPMHRRKGHSSHILGALETWAKELGFDTARLETGKAQPEAIGMYQKHGYTIVENFPPYVGMDNSVCMQKTLRS